MRSIHSTLLALGLMLSIPLTATDNISFVYPEQELAKTEEDTAQGGGAIQLSSSINYIGNSKFDKKHKNHHLGNQSYNEESVDALGVFYYNPLYKEGIAAIVGYDHTEFRWNRNPYFHQKNFNTVSVGLVGFTHRLCDWMWRGQLNFNFDVNHFRWSQYVSEDFFWWGRYDYSDCIGVNIGLLGYTGMKIDRLFPIIGVDWKINDAWKINAIFPADMSVVYTFNENLNFVLAARAFFSRHRVGKDEELPRGLLQYQNLGIELGVNYAPLSSAFGYLSNFDINVHGGYAVGGRIKIANRHYHHSHRFYFKSAPYGGGEVSFKF